MSIGIIDYGAGNLHSVANAVRHLGFAPTLVTGEAQLEQIDRLIFPGVGSFGDCAAALSRLGLTQGIVDWIARDRPYLGICLGYQILFESSDESAGVAGLGTLAGRCLRFPTGRLKIPHMGWNTISPTDHDDPLWEGLPPDPSFYFVHSYYPQPSEPWLVAAWCEYGTTFAAAVRRGNLVATQFHPEKSQHNGLALLRNFLSAR